MADRWKIERHLVARGIHHWAAFQTQVIGEPFAIREEGGDISVWTKTPIEEAPSQCEHCTLCLSHHLLVEDESWLCCLCGDEVTAATTVGAG